MSALDYYNAVKDINDMMYENSVRLLEKVCIDLDAVDRIDELKEKYLDDAFTKLKPKRDPNKPKRPVSSYILFCNDLREEIKSKYPNLSFGEINKTLGKKWKEYEDKQKYIELAETHKMKYQEEIDEYNKQNGLMF